jgi:hypothetical protein
VILADADEFRSNEAVHAVHGAVSGSFGRT